MADSVYLTVLELKNNEFLSQNLNTINAVLPLNIDLGSKYIYLVFVEDEV